MHDLWVWVAPKLGDCLLFAVVCGIAWSWAGMIGERVEARHARRQAEIEARERRIRDFDRRARRLLRDVYGGGGALPGWTIVDHAEHSPIAPEMSFHASNDTLAVVALLACLPNSEKQT